MTHVYIWKQSNVKISGNKGLYFYDLKVREELGWEGTGHLSATSARGVFYR